MSTGRAGPTIIAGQVDDVCVRFGNTHSDDTDAWNDRNLDGHAGLGVDCLELFDKLCQVFNRVNVMVVGWGDQIHAGARMPRRGNFRCDFARGQVTTFARLCSLTDFDLQQVRCVDCFCRNTEPTRGNLNAAIEWILAEQIGNLAALAVE